MSGTFLKGLNHLRYQLVSRQIMISKRWHLKVGTRGPPTPICPGFDSRNFVVFRALQFFL